VQAVELQQQLVQLLREQPPALLHLTVRVVTAAWSPLCTFESATVPMLLSFRIVKVQRLQPRLLPDPIRCRRRCK
jgi:hypothetical protein